MVVGKAKDSRQRLAPNNRAKDWWGKVLFIAMNSCEESKGILTPAANENLLVYLIHNTSFRLTLGLDAKRNDWQWC